MSSNSKQNALKPSISLHNYGNESLSKSLKKSQTRVQLLIWKKKYVYFCIRPYLKWPQKRRSKWNHFPAITIRRKTLSHCHSQHNIVTFSTIICDEKYNYGAFFSYFIICQLSFQVWLNNAGNKFLIINFITMDIVLR